MFPSLFRRVKHDGWILVPGMTAEQLCSPGHRLRQPQLLQQPEQATVTVAQAQNPFKGDLKVTVELEMAVV